MHEDLELASSTITSYKSALAQPLWQGFGINLNSELFNRIPKACANLRPRAPPRPISWSLSRVLELAASIDNSSAALKPLSRKCLFLLAMASGARMSELVALLRGDNHVQFLESGEVLLFPDPAFLAKNELPTRRWGPWRIAPLPEDPSLCPVECLRGYLAASSNWTDGQLFRTDEGTEIHIRQLRAKLLYFIKEADPNSVPAGHDCRRLASSLNFFKTMSFEGLQAYTGWRSPRVFFRHYLRTVEGVDRSFVAAGTVVGPSAEPAV